MLEVLGRAAILHPLRSTQSHVANGPVPSLARRTMERNLRANFFTPHPRHVKGKEKAREAREYICSDCSRHHFLPSEVYTPKASRTHADSSVHVPSALPPARPRAYKRYRSHHLPHSVRKHSPSETIQKKAVPANQRRHASNIPKTPQDSKPASIVQQSPFNRDDAWAVYTAARAAPGGQLPSPNELLSLGEEILASLEQDTLGKQSLTALHLWAHRVYGLLEILDAQVIAKNRLHFQLQCIKARTLALIGDLPAARELADSLHASVEPGGENHALCVQVFETIVLSTDLHLDVAQAFDCLVVLRERLGLSTYYSLHRSSTRHLVHSMLNRINNPAEYLASRVEWEIPAREWLAQFLISTLCSQNLPYDAYAVLQEMKKQGLHACERLQLHLIRCLAREDAFAIANPLFASLPVTNERSYLHTALFLFAHQGNVALTFDYHSRIAQRKLTSEASVALLMHVYAVQGRAQEAVSLFHRFFPESAPEGVAVITPNLKHYTIVAQAYAVQGDIDGLTQWLGRMSQAGIKADLHLYTVIIKAFGQNADIDALGALLDQMSAAGIQPSAATYTTIIALLARRRDPVGAEALYKRALQNGIQADRRMVTTIMNAHVEAGSWKGVIRVFDYLKSSPHRHLQLSIEVYNTLLKAYVLIGMPFRTVSKLFYKLEAAGLHPDSHTFALVIQSACDAGLLNVASDLFMKMEKQAENWQTGIRVNAFVLTIIMSAFLRSGQRSRARAVYDDMCRRGIDPTSVTYANIIRSYANRATEGSLKVAENFLHSLITDSPEDRKHWARPSGGRRHAVENLFTPLMNLYARKWSPANVERLYKSMLDHGGEPSIGTLSALLHAYRQTNNIRAAKQLWPQIHQQALRYSNIDPLFSGHSRSGHPGIYRQANVLCIPLSIYIDALSAAGHHDDVPLLWRTLQVDGFAFDSHNWNHLAVALVRAGQPERAFEILEKVILPYYRKSKRFSKARDMAPSSPLTFDDHAPGPDTPASSELLHLTLRRKGVARMTAKAIRFETFGLDTEGVVDFAHPLHILHQISPAWNAWRPHGTVLRLLIRVLHHLRSGLAIQPLRGDDPSFTPERDPEKLREMRDVAEELLERIHRNYPKAVAAVQDMGQKYRL